MNAITFWRMMACLLFAMLGGMTQSADLESIHAQRALIDQARQAVESEWAQQDQACRQRFTVTSCRNEAQATRSSKLNALRAKEIELNAIEREERTQQAKERLMQRQSDQADRLEKARSSERPIIRDQQDGLNSTNLPEPKGRGIREPKTPNLPTLAEQEKKSKDHRDRVQEAEQHRIDLGKRYATPPAKPLPTPQTGDFPK